jgi:hypothetical protein
MLQKELLTLRSLQTVLGELTCIINDRTLGVTDNDPSQWTVVTPNLLVYGRQMNEFVTANIDNGRGNFLHLYAARKRVLNQLWDQWKKQYVEELSVNRKWTNRAPVNLKSGDVVILKKDSNLKNSWSLARIETIQKNKENVVVAITVRKPNGQILERTVRQVALLEPDCTEETEPNSPQRIGSDGSQDETKTDPDFGRPTGFGVPTSSSKPTLPGACDGRGDVDPGTQVSYCRSCSSNLERQ